MILQMADWSSLIALPVVADAFASFTGKGGNKVEGEVWGLKVREVSKESWWRYIGVIVHTYL